MQVTYILMLVFAVIIALFAAFNGGNVDINLLFTSIQLPQAVVIIGSAAIGAILGYSFDLLKRIKSSLRVKELEKKNAKLEKEVETLQQQIQETKEISVPKEEKVELGK